jgi:hypothetical protein
MSHEEQQKIREKYYTEAIRYMDNAKETLRTVIFIPMVLKRKKAGSQ